MNEANILYIGLKDYKVGAYDTIYIVWCVIPILLKT